MGITEFLAGHITKFIETTGYIIVFIWMMLDSMPLPVPSWAVMPFAGFLIAEGKFSFLGVIFFSTLGSIVGSLIAYTVGKYGGKPFVNKFGKYLLLEPGDLEATERFFRKYGEWAILIGRFISVVSNLISIPAGVAKMNILRFSIFTIIGAGLWNSFLMIAGFYLKQNWHLVREYSKIADTVILCILAFLVFLFIVRHIKRKKYSK